MKGFVFTLTDAQVHAKKHGYELQFNDFRQKYGDEAALAVVSKDARKLQKKSRQNATEKEFGLILATQKRRNEIIDYKAFGIRLEWGANPDTEKPQVYSPDYIVWPKPLLGTIRKMRLRVVEVKGPHIYPKDMIRFRGCRAEWAEWFEFEMHQKGKDGIWRRIE